MSGTLRTGLDLSEVRIQSLCKCQFWKDCDWSNTEVNDISELPKGSTNWKLKVDFFKVRICDKKERTVYCCGSNEEFPRDSELKILKKKESTNVRKWVTCQINYKF